MITICTLHSAQFLDCQDVEIKFCSDFKMHKVVLWQGNAYLGAKRPCCVVSVLSDTSSVRFGLFLPLVYHHTGTLDSTSYPLYRIIDVSRHSYQVSD